MLQANQSHPGSEVRRVTGLPPGRLQALMRSEESFWIYATDPKGLLGRWTLPGTAWLAAISCSLYLGHTIAMYLVHEMVAPVLSQRVQGLALFSFYALAVLALGAPLHYLVESPFLRWRDPRARSRSAASKPPAGDVLTL